MMYDIFLANQWLLLTWASVFVALVGFHFLTKRAAIQAAIAGDKEALTGHSFLISWVWTFFLVVTILGVICVGLAQSINWTPRQTEDRNNAEQDQKNFERRINEKLKQKGKQ